MFENLPYFSSELQNLLHSNAGQTCFLILMLFFALAPSTTGSSTTMLALLLGSFSRASEVQTVACFHFMSGPDRVDILELLSVSHSLTFMKKFLMFI